MYVLRGRGRGGLEPCRRWISSGGDLGGFIRPGLLRYPPKPARSPMPRDLTESLVAVLLAAVASEPDRRVRQERALRPCELADG